MAVQAAFFQELGHDLGLCGAVEGQFAAAQAVFRIGEQIVQRHDHIVAGQVGGDVIGVGDADVGGGAGGDVGDDIVVNIAVVGIEPQRDRDIGVQA